MLFRSGKPFTTFSIIVGTHKDEFDNWVNDFQPCVAYANLAEYINELSQEQNRTKYLVGGTLRENEFNGNLVRQILVEYISPQPTVKETGKKQPKSSDEDFGDGEIEFSD